MDQVRRLRTAPLWPAFAELQAAAVAQERCTDNLDAAIKSRAALPLIGGFEAAESRAIAATTKKRATLLAGQTASSMDAALKLIAIVATGQPGPDSSREFPWAELSALLRELINI